MKNAFREVTVKILDNIGNIAGTGFLYEKYIITCAHVINNISDTSSFFKNNTTVNVEFFNHKLLQATVVGWPSYNDYHKFGLDVAVLELQDSDNIFKKKRASVGFVCLEEFEERKFITYGFGNKNGIIAKGIMYGEGQNGIVQVETLNIYIIPGFSGAPVFDSKTKSIVGMIVSFQPSQMNTSYFIKSDRILEVLSKTQNNPSMFKRVTRIPSEFYKKCNRDLQYVALQNLVTADDSNFKLAIMKGCNSDKPHHLVDRLLNDLALSGKSIFGSTTDYIKIFDGTSWGTHMRNLSTYYSGVHDNTNISKEIVTDINADIIYEYIEIDYTNNLVGISTNAVKILKRHIKDFWSSGESVSPSKSVFLFITFLIPEKNSLSKKFIEFKISLIERMISKLTRHVMCVPRFENISIAEINRLLEQMGIENQLSIQGNLNYSDVEVKLKQIIK
ncbi:MAG: serine protease [bacterium]|nr:serine protease [bacterium]